MEFDSHDGMIRALERKLESLVVTGLGLVCRAKRDRRWLHVHELASLAGRTQFLFLAIKPVRYYLRELHREFRTAPRTPGAGASGRMAHHLRRDLEWWTAAPTHKNGRSIYKPVETVDMHVDSSRYGWGAVLNEITEGRGTTTTASAHHLRGASCFPVRRAHLPLRTAVSIGTGPRGQRGASPHPRQPYLPLSRAHARATEVVVLPRHQRHLHSLALHQDHGNI